MALIILMGPKHSGKTSTGRELARLLKLPFHDLDQIIEERAKQSPRELFLTGLELFQQEEMSALLDLLKKESVLKESHKSAKTQKNKYDLQIECYTGVLALGGGIIDNPGAMALLNNDAAKHHTLFLELSAETAWKRISDQRELPPFLKADTPEAAREKHRILHERRNGLYKKYAQNSIFVKEKKTEELAKELYNFYIKRNVQK